jgi:hypothetical protein
MRVRFTLGWSASRASISAAASGGIAAWRTGTALAKAPDLRASTGRKPDSQTRHAQTGRSLCRYYREQRRDVSLYPGPQS